MRNAIIVVALVAVAGAAMAQGQVVGDPPRSGNSPPTWTRAEMSILNGKPYVMIPAVERINSNHSRYSYGAYNGYTNVSEQMGDDIKELAWRIEKLEQRVMMPVSSGNIMLNLPGGTQGLITPSGGKK